ncbi:hypothetical protein JTE90_015372 [Oedothorax gibbosus]|uniref:Uncharacterized protein n=1 Tax=Oedothorax gibbosus TaxID=931172 RepID=A0AAV6U472_9ARAC|nr:hypothetical protein JTE90_015372 [Oedothorax gibbosus]
MEIPTQVKFIILSLSLVTVIDALGSDPYDFSSSYFCSTCFTNNQDQNYHCCFYFFKCCSDARRGLKPTSTVPKYPALPTQIAYIVQDKTLQPCSCRSNNGEASVLCCLSWSPPQHTTEGYVKAAQEYEGYVEADSMVKNSTENEEDEQRFASSWPTSEKYPDTDKPFHMALGANVNPSNLDSKYFSKKLFIPPSLASGHESFDIASNKEGISSRKLGWVTKDLLKFSEDERK